MADVTDKYELNVEGKFYVDEQCIDCDLCRETAPRNFTREEDEGYSDEDEPDLEDTQNCQKNKKLMAALDVKAGEKVLYSFAVTDKSHTVGGFSLFSSY